MLINILSEVIQAQKKKTYLSKSKLPHYTLECFVLTFQGILIQKLYICT